MRSRFREISSLPAYRNEPCKAWPASSFLVESADANLLDCIACRPQISVTTSAHSRESERERERERELFRVFAIAKQTGTQYRRAPRENRSYVYPLSPFIPESYSPMNTPRASVTEITISSAHVGHEEGRGKREARGGSRAALAGPDLLRRAA